MSNNPATDATLITVAPTGAEADKTAVPALPVTLDELVTTAKECQAAGASVVHVHIRDAQAQPTLDLSRLTDTVPALAAGGHLRVGMEDTISFARGRPVTGNLELVERAATLAGLAQRPPMRPDQARAILGVSERH